MGDSNDIKDIKDIKKAYGKTEEIGRRIWLAGLGAYAQSFENVQNGVEKLNNETRTYFEKLVAKGEELETHTRKAINETRENAVKKTNSKIREHTDKIASQAEKLQNFSLESLSLERLKPENPGLEKFAESINGRLEDIRSKINDILPGIATRDDIQSLSQKIDKLTAASRAARAARTTKKAGDPKAGDSESGDSE